MKITAIIFKNAPSLNENFKALSNVVGHYNVGFISTKNLKGCHIKQKNGELIHIIRLLNDLYAF